MQVHVIDPATTPVVILCGGMGTRLREASEKLPKPLVDIGGRPVLWHVMKVYSQHGFRRFVLCLGYKGDLIKHYFLDHRTMTSDFTLRLGGDREITYHRSTADEDWEVTFAETGLLSGTGARLRRVRPYLHDAGTFLLTYGDGIGDIDVTRLVEQHEASGRLGMVTAVHPAGRYGEMTLAPDLTAVAEFHEKPARTNGWVSGGYFVFDRSFADDYLDDDPGLFFERRPLQRLAADGQLGVHLHEGFWMGMDTYRDWTELNALWDRGEAPWRTWAADDDRS
jgi:glucose-1-phosphate cytidylyltransferase